MNRVLTVDGIKQADKTLTFLGSDSDIQAGINTNVVEYKSAWMVVDDHNPLSNYLVVPARIPHYVVNGSSLTQDKKNGQLVFDNVKVALLANGAPGTVIEVMIPIESPPPATVGRD